MRIVLAALFGAVALSNPLVSIVRAAKPLPLRPTRTVCRIACECLCNFSPNQFPPGFDGVREERERGCRKVCRRSVFNCHHFEGGTRLGCKLIPAAFFLSCSSGVFPDDYTYGCLPPP